MVNRNPCSATIPAVFCYLCGCTTWLPDRFSPECEAVTTIFCVEIAATLAMHCAGQADHWSGSQWPVAWPVARRLAAVMVSLCAEFQMVKILISLCLMRPGVEHFLYCKTASKCILCRVCRVQDSRTGSLWTCCLHILHRQGCGRTWPNHAKSFTRRAKQRCSWCYRQLQVGHIPGWVTNLFATQSWRVFRFPDCPRHTIFCLWKINGRCLSPVFLCHMCFLKSAVFQSH